MGISNHSAYKYDIEGICVADNRLRSARRCVHSDNICVFQSFFKKRRKAQCGKRTIPSNKIQDTRFLHQTEKSQKIQKYIYIYKMPVVQKRFTF